MHPSQRNLMGNSFIILYWNPISPTSKTTETKQALYEILFTMISNSSGDPSILQPSGGSLELSILL